MAHTNQLHSFRTRRPPQTNTILQHLPYTACSCGNNWSNFQAEKNSTIWYWPKNNTLQFDANFSTTHTMMYNLRQISTSLVMYSEPCHWSNNPINTTILQANWTESTAVRINWECRINKQSVGLLTYWKIFVFTCDARASSVCLLNTECPFSRHCYIRCHRTCQ